MPDKNTKRHRFDAEIFAVGTWNGQTFTPADLEQIAANFEALKAQIKPPVKMGHNDKQRMTDGAPALGWVEGLKVVGDKLVATLADVPTVVMEAIRKRLYRRVSAEIYTDVRIAGKKLGKALKAVALLGADIPAVSTLADLDAFLATAPGLAAGEFAGVASFSAIAGEKGGTSNPHTEDTPMELKELSEKVDRLSGQVSKFSEENGQLRTENAELKTKNQELETKITSFTKAEETRKADDAKARIEKKRSDAKALFEAAVAQKIMLPAERESALAVFSLDDDAAVLALDLKKVEAFINARGKTLKFGEEAAQAANANKSGEEDLPADQRLARATRKYMADHKVDFAAASEAVLQSDPELGAAYVEQVDAIYTPKGGVA